MSHSLLTHPAYPVLDVRPNRTRAIRVCHLGKYYAPAVGGIETHVRTLARAQADLGAQVRILCANHHSGPTVTARDGPVEVVHCRRWVAAAKLDVCPDAVVALRATDADIVHLHAPNPLMTLAILAARPRCLVITHHSDHVRQRLRALLFQPIERHVYGKAAAIIGSSPAYAASSPLLRAFGDRVRVVPYGIDTDALRRPSPEDCAEAARLRERYAAPLWLACGRLVYYKGLQHALAALVHLPGTLLVVGEGPQRGSLTAEVSRLGLAKRVAFLGCAPSVVPYYLAAVALWFPSNARSEAFGFVQLEAMACGLPVINTAIPGSGVSWVSRHAETGLTVPPDDPLALAAAARGLLAEAGLRERLGRAGRERVRREFDHRVMAAKTLELYEQVLAQLPARPNQ